MVLKETVCALSVFLSLYAQDIASLAVPGV